ncbi:hypothetical protein OCL06_08620 [Alteromonas sp. ASW11-19]|uniref:Uncharacterized protein n=1 Tax=Alteromonas salexigens TaxID=2982530 RepID=A0ABT2VMW8_9ALTE|nr:hypothetical protein [Alteromonas salexigens]MCU7554661.1 hypothetical protein [Alteromonas salexigens]
MKKWILLLLVSSFLSACATGPSYRFSAIPMPSQSIVKKNGAYGMGERKGYVEVGMGFADADRIGNSHPYFTMCIVNEHSEKAIGFDRSAVKFQTKGGVIAPWTLLEMKDIVASHHRYQKYSAKFFKALMTLANVAASQHTTTSYDYGIVNVRSGGSYVAELEYTSIATKTSTDLEKLSRYKQKTNEIFDRLLNDLDDSERAALRDLHDYIRPTIVEPQHMECVRLGVSPDINEYTAFEILVEVDGESFVFFYQNEQTSA